MSIELNLHSQTEARSSEEIRQVEIGPEGRKLKGNVYFPKEQKPNMPGVLIVHGWRGDQLGKSKMIAITSTQEGYIAMTFDMRGHGETVGNIAELSFADYMDDLRSAFDEFSRIPSIDQEKITIVSTSFSSYLAALLSQERPVHSLVLRSPGNYRDEDVLNQSSPAAIELVEKKRQETYAWRLQKQEPNDNRALDAIHKFQGDILLVASGKDEFIPNQTIQNFINSVPDKSRLTAHTIEGASHALKEESSVVEFKRVLSDWLRLEINKSALAGNKKDTEI